MDIIAILQIVNFGSQLAARGSELIVKLKEAGRDKATDEEIAALNASRKTVDDAWARLFPEE